MFLLPVQCTYYVSCRWRINRLLTPGCNNNSGIGNGRENCFIAKVDDIFETSVCCHEQAQVLSIFGSVPLVGRDERNYAMRFEQFDRAFVEEDV
ncbi:hypothetical protein D9M69_425740 [compost metagenome]